MMRFVEDHQIVRRIWRRAAAQLFVGHPLCINPCCRKRVPPHASQRGWGHDEGGARFCREGGGNESLAETDIIGEQCHTVTLQCLTQPTECIPLMWAQGDFPQHWRLDIAARAEPQLRHGRLHQRCVGNDHTAPHSISGATTSSVSPYARAAMLACRAGPAPSFMASSARLARSQLRGIGSSATVHARWRRYPPRAGSANARSQAAHTGDRRRTASARASSGSAHRNT